MSGALELPVAPWKKRPKESPVNASVRKYAKARDWKAIRIVRASENQLPDWLIYTRMGLSFWIESKRLGDGPRRAQQIRHDEMREYNITVFVCDDDESVRRVFYAV